MAAPNFSSGERMHIYRLLFLLNRSFHLIVQRLEELEKIGVCRSRDLAEMRGLTQEIQLEINTGVLNSFESVEANDWAHFGKIRTAMEKRLRGRK